MRKPLKAFIYCLCIVGFQAAAQETITIDSLKTATLNEVVVTGQIEPQSIKKSVFNVRVITKADIQRQAANNLADVLNQYLNITIQPSSGQGRSTVSMFGLDGQYFKILVDNVPLVSDTGLGNNVDLTQINLDDIEQLEIIEGSMGVTHGANAVSGVINIITKKGTKNKIDISATVQEETIGNEYSAFGKEGRHIQAIRAGFTINQNWFASVGSNRNDFQGFLDKRGGRLYTESQLDNPELQRGYSWLPKEQIFTNALVRYQKNNTRIFYRFEYLDENLDYYNNVINTEYDETTQSLTRIAQDRRFFTHKIYNHLNAVGKLFSQLDYNVSLSYQNQERELEDYKYYIQRDTEANNKTQTYQESDVLYSIGTLTNFFKDKKYDLQVGYEAVNTNGYNASVAGLFNPNGDSGNIKRRLENYDLFSAAEININEKFSFRPGYRYSFQSKFKDQWAASLGLRYLLNYGIEARTSYGRSYRTPNYDELYTYFVDANHFLIGNEDLLPETSNSAEVNLKKMTYLQSGLQLSNSITASYLDVNDRIETVIIATQPRLQYQTANIDTYKMWNISTTNQLNYNNWQVKAGFTVAGISRKISTGLIASDDRFLTAYQANANIAYTIPSVNTVISAFYKLNGRQQQFIQTIDNNGAEIFVLQELDTFSLFDASVKTLFFNNRFDVTLGARNLLNVVNVQSNVAEAGAHSAGSTANLLGYGRSYFVKLTYNLNI